MNQLEYRQPSDAIRRAVIRYYYPIYHVLAEYVPFLINKGVLPIAFTQRELHVALNNLGIRCSHSSLYERIKEKYNPIIGSIDEDPLLKSSNPFREAVKKKGGKRYYIRPIHKMKSMIEDTAFFREYEAGYKTSIPPLEIYDEIIDSESIEAINRLYENLDPRLISPTDGWMNLFYHFTDFRDETRTPIDDSIVEKPILFKVAFFNAVVKEGKYSKKELMKMTGIPKEGIRYVVDKSKFVSEEKILILEAPTYWKALKDAGEDALYAHKLDNNNYLVQMKNQISISDVQKIPIKAPARKPLNRPMNGAVRRNLAYPGFQETFLVRALKITTQKAYNLPIPNNILSLHDMVSFIKTISPLDK